MSNASIYHTCASVILVRDSSGWKKIGLVFQTLEKAEENSARLTQSRIWFAPWCVEFLQGVGIFIV